MTLGWSEHPAARQEFFDALVWYDDHGPGLGDRLALEFAASIQFIRDWPEVASPYPECARNLAVRAKRIDGFPYRIIYLVLDDEIVVVAYAHERRRPGYWRARVSNVPG